MRAFYRTPRRLLKRYSLVREMSFGLAVDTRRTFTVSELEKRAFDFTLIEAGSYLVGWFQNR